MTTKSSGGYARIAGVLTLGVFAISVYIGLYDKILQSVKAHWYIDWVIAAASLVAAGLLLAKPLTLWTVELGGMVWPVVYVASLGFDVYTKLCAGVSQNYCWSSRTAAFQYLILNNPKAPGQGWTLFHYTEPLALGFIFIACILSIFAAVSIRRSSMMHRSVPPSIRLVVTLVLVVILIMVSALTYVALIPAASSIVSSSTEFTETTVASTTLLVTSSPEVLSSTSITSSGFSTSSSPTSTVSFISSLTPNQTSSNSSSMTSTQTMNATSSLSTSTTSNSSASISSPSGAAQIVIDNYAFSPAVATVIIGVNNTVVWTNLDYVTHTVTSNTGLFNSLALGHNQSWSFTFTTPGNYSYYCVFHPGMRGIIMVQAAPAAYSQSSMPSVPTIFQAGTRGMIFTLLSVAYLIKLIAKMSPLG